MGYNKKRMGTSFLVSLLLMVALIYLVASSMIAMALLPAVGVGGLYAQADTLEGEVGTLYPEYQGNENDLLGFDEYEVPITTTVPGCTGVEGQDGIPMYVVSLDGEARAVGFDFRKDVSIPFLEDRWMVIEINDITLSGENIKIFSTQLAGDSLLIRNVRVIEGGVEDELSPSGENWGIDSSQFVIQGGQGTDPNVPGLEADNIEAWIHGATGERITLEGIPGEEFVEVDVSYRETSQVMDFYDGTTIGEEAKLGFDLPDENPDFDGEDRLQRGMTAGEGYFTCSDIGGVP